MKDLLPPRVTALEALFRRVERTRMAGVPVLNPALRVEAVGFEHVADDGKGKGEETAPAAAGVLLTPWFMNLVWLPLRPVWGPEAAWPVGQARERSVGGTVFEFIAAHEPDFGAYAACSLASPMFEYVDQSQARATAAAVLAALRSVPAAALPQPARRGFLFGRSALEGRA